MDNETYLSDYLIRQMYRADRDPFRESVILADALDYVDAYTEDPQETARIWAIARDRAHAETGIWPKPLESWR